jgi:O-acetylhomoserine/O-acetylserine sulfhydrylase-like pyridoxal-dependent enzyme
LNSPQNEFRIRLTEEKIRVDGVKGQNKAEGVHASVGAKIRKTVIEEIGRPQEKLPRAESIKKIAGRRRKELKSK